MMRKLWTRLLQAVLAIGVASVASAHPGHGPDGGAFSVAHYLTEPLHVLGAVSLLAGAVAGSWLLRSRRLTRAQ